MLVPVIGGADAMCASFRAQALLAHESCHPLAPAVLPFGSQRGLNAWAAIHLAVRLIQPHDTLPQHC